jgi:hypothetical protein
VRLRASEANVARTYPNNKIKTAWNIPQVVPCLPNKCEDLHPIPNTYKSNPGTIKFLEESIERNIITLIIAMIFFNRTLK